MSFMFSRHPLKILAFLALCSISLGLGACGRKSAPIPPGPDNHINYPRIYPSE